MDFDLPMAAAKDLQGGNPLQYVQEVGTHQAHGTPLFPAFSPGHLANNGHDEGQDGRDDEQDHAGRSIYPEDRYQ